MKNIKKYRIWGLAFVFAIISALAVGSQSSHNEPPELDLSESLFLGKSTLNSSENQICDLSIPTLSELPLQTSTAEADHNANVNSPLKNSGKGLHFYYAEHPISIADVFASVESSSDNKVFVATYMTKEALKATKAHLDISSKNGFYVYPELGIDTDIENPSSFIIPAGNTVIVGSCEAGSLHGVHSDQRESEWSLGQSRSLTDDWMLLPTPKDFFRNNSKGKYMRNQFPYAKSIWIQTGLGFTFEDVTEDFENENYLSIQSKAGNHSMMWLEFSPDKHALVTREHISSSLEQTKTSVRSPEAGELIELSNNITVEVEEVKLVDDRSWGQTVFLTVTHSIDGNRTTSTPTKHILVYENEHMETWNEASGYKVEVKNINAQGDFTLEFTPLTGYLENSLDLYNECLYQKDSARLCHKYSLFKPLPDEIELQSDNFRLYGPKSGKNYLEGRLNQFEQCYQSNLMFMDLEEKNIRSLIRYLRSDSNTLVTSIHGIVIPYYGNYLADQDDNGECSDKFISHELVHLIVQKSALSSILNEGLATFIAAQIYNERELSCEESGYNLDGKFHTFGYLNLYEQIPYLDGGLELYYTAACFWDEYYTEFARANFVKTLKLLIDDEKSESQGSTIDLLEENLSLDLSSYLSKYGFNYTDDTYSAEGRAESYSRQSSIGSVGSTW
jgi:hypothetical protein